MRIADHLSGFFLGRGLDQRVSQHEKASGHHQESDEEQPFGIETIVGIYGPACEEES